LPKQSQDRSLNLKRVVFINQDAGYLIVDIANYFESNGYDVSIVCGKLIERKVKLSESIKLSRISYYNRASIFSKFISWIKASFQILLLCVFKYRKYEIFFFSNPPLSFFIPFLLPLKYNLVVFDLYPDVLVESGQLSRHSIIISIWFRINKSVYRNANRIITLSTSIKNRIQQYCTSKEIEVIPIWGSLNHNEIKYNNQNNLYRIQLGLEDKFVVLYSGNLGNSHELMVIPQLASIITDKKVLFLIVGNGPGKKELLEFSTKNNLKNIMFLERQPVENLIELFSAANVAIVPFSSKIAGLSIPSKTFDFLAAGLPLIIIGEEDTELAKLVCEFDNGKVFQPSQLNELSNYLSSLSKSKGELDLKNANSIKASAFYSVNHVKNYLKS
jgi:hypothetical protein